jgi:hypothetical protein
MFGYNWKMSTIFCLMFWITDLWNPLTCRKWEVGTLAYMQRNAQSIHYTINATVLLRPNQRVSYSIVTVGKSASTIVAVKFGCGSDWTGKSTKLLQHLTSFKHTSNFGAEYASYYGSDPGPWLDKMTLFILRWCLACYEFCPFAWLIIIDCSISGCSDIINLFIFYVISSLKAKYLFCSTFVK